MPPAEPAPLRSTPRAIRGALLVGRLLALYAFAVVALTWPLARHAATHLPNTHVACQFDTLYCAWALVHQVRALTDAGVSLSDAGIYAPATLTFFYGDVGFGALPYFLPTFLLTANPALALNVMFLVSLALTALGLHLVVRNWTGSDPAGFVAACTFLATRWTLYEFLPTAPIYAVLQYFPIIIFLAAQPARSFRAALVLLPFIVLQSLSSFIYVSAAVMGPLGLLAVGRLLRPRTRAAGFRLLAILALATAALVPFGLNYLRVRAANPNLRQQTVWSFTVPTRVPWGLLQGTAPTGVAVGVLVLIAVGLALFLIDQYRGHRQIPSTAWVQGAFWAVAGTYLSLTPRVWWHQTLVPLPQTLLEHLLPIYDIGFMRTPHRLGLAGLMGIAILSGAAFASCARWLVRDRAKVALVLAGLLAAEMYAELHVGFNATVRGALGPEVFRKAEPLSYPLTRAIEPSAELLPFLRGAGGPLLELPIAMTPLPCWPPPQARAMYRAIFHRRPLVNGYSGYWPAGFRERMMQALRLPEPSALRALRRETGVALILIHTGEIEPSQRVAWMHAATSRRDLRLLARDGEDLLFAVDAPPAAP